MRAGEWFEFALILLPYVGVYWLLYVVATKNRQIQELKNE